MLRLAFVIHSEFVWRQKSLSTRAFRLRHCQSVKPCCSTHWLPRRFLLLFVAVQSVSVFGLCQMVGLTVWSIVACPLIHGLVSIRVQH